MCKRSQAVPGWSQSHKSPPGRTYGLAFFTTGERDDTVAAPLSHLATSQHTLATAR